MKNCHIAFLWGFTFLSLTGIQAFPGSKTGRCSCINVTKAKIQKNAIKFLDKFPPDSSCSHTEIIATMKDGKKICLDPCSPHVNLLVKAWKKMDDKKNKSKTRNERRQTKKAKKMRKAQHPPPRMTA